MKLFRRVAVAAIGLCVGVTAYAAQVKTPLENGAWCESDIQAQCIPNGSPIYTCNDPVADCATCCGTIYPGNSADRLACQQRCQNN